MAFFVIAARFGSCAWTAAGFSRLYFSMVRLPLLNRAKTFLDSVPARSVLVATVWVAGEPRTSYPLASSAASSAASKRDRPPPRMTSAVPLRAIWSATGVTRTSWSAGCR